MKTGLVYDPIYLKHDTGQHVENARRLEGVTTLLGRNGLEQQLIMIQPEPASVEEISLVHAADYVSQIERKAQAGGGWLDADTIMSSGSYQAALYAAGGLVKASGLVMSREIDNAFALVRPPGHHARQRNAKGFCLFNNIAIAAKHLMKRYQLERILIVDFDVHHGNGTQETFYSDPGVLYFSTHQFPFYPGTGEIKETGAGEGKGANVNVPLPAGCGDEEYLTVFRELLIPLARRFNPQFVLVSAGYDAHWKDPLAMMQITVTGFAQIVTILRDLAAELCQGRMVFTLEGGYNIEALAYSVKATLAALSGKLEIDDPLGKPHYQREVLMIEGVKREVKQVHHIE